MLKNQKVSPRVRLGKATLALRSKPKAGEAGIATVFGLLLVALMVGGMAVTIEIVRNPTDFSSSASTALNRVNVFNTDESPVPTPKVVSSPTPSTQVMANQFSVQINRGPYTIIPGSHCFDLVVSQTSCQSLSLSYSFDNDPASPQPLEKADNCSYTGTVCSQKEIGSHILKVKAISENKEESDETVLNYELK